MGYRKRTNAKSDDIIEVNEEIVPESVPQEDPQEEPEITPNNAEMEAARRKQEIADKRRASLALARTKIIPKSAIKKQAEEAVKTVEEVIKTKDAQLKNKQEETDAMRLKYERERVKQLEDSLITLQKLVADRPMPNAEKVEKPEPVVEVKQKYKRPSRSKAAIAERMETPTKQPQQPQQPTQIIPKKSVEPRIVARAAPASTEKLIDKSYGEQLQERLRSQAINKIMMETFGGF